MTATLPVPGAEAPTTPTEAAERYLGVKDSGVELWGHGLTTYEVCVDSLIASSRS